MDQSDQQGREDPDRPPRGEHHWQRPPSDEAVWTYRGYQMRASEFNAAMVHFFRGEISRSNTWRMRLDATTNWAVLTTGATISFAFTSRGTGVVDHGVIILNTLLITVFLLIEARRYRYYELWSYRVRLMETDFYAAMLVPPFQPAPDWAETLADSLLHPQFPISRAEAFGRRFRRNYMLIYLLLGSAWFLKVWLHPVPAQTLDEFVNRAAIGDVPGWMVLAAGVLFNAIVLAAGGLTVGLRDTAGEVLPRYGEAGIPRLGLGRDGSGSQDGPRSHVRAWFRPRSRRRNQLLTYTITGRPDIVAPRIIEELGRGVTAIPGRGVYSGQDRGVLLCAVTVTEVAHLRDVVKQTDPDAFVIVSPVRAVLGEGFVPLEGDGELDGGRGERDRGGAGDEATRR